MNVRPGADYLLKVTNESGTAVFCRLSCQYRQRLHDLMRNHEVIVGEWSLGYPLDDVTALKPYERDIALRGFAANQLEVYEESRGWVFWSYKVTDSMKPWSLRACVENGWLLSHF